LSDLGAAKGNRQKCFENRREETSGSHPRGEVGRLKQEQKKDNQFLKKEVGGGVDTLRR